jgi:hypothetical protein
VNDSYLDSQIVSPLAFANTFLVGNTTAKVVQKNTGLVEPVARGSQYGDELSPMLVGLSTWNTQVNQGHILFRRTLGIRSIFIIVDSDHVTQEGNEREIGVWNRGASVRSV